MNKLKDFPLVDCHWLAKQLKQTNSKVIVFDASMTNTIPGVPESSTDCFIPGAIAFDFDQDICDKSSLLPHMLPSAEQFTEQLQTLGVNHDNIIVIYDSQGIFSAPRAWWMCQVFGCKQTYVLNGGLPAWITAGYDTVAELSQAKGKGDFSAHLQSKLVVNREQVLTASNKRTATIIDARSSTRFNGTAPEPRPELSSGHMPNAINLPFNQVLIDTGFADKKTLKAIFTKLNINPAQPLIFSCGSGVTACIIMIAAYICGYNKLAVYDGSWCEWASNPDSPIVTLAR